MSRRELVRLGLWWVVAGVAATGLGFVLAGRTLVGSYVTVTALLAGAMARLVLPARRVGGLAVRSRTVDVVSLILLATALFTAVTLVDLSRR
jgi:hypothetical protein